MRFLDTTAAPKYGSTPIYGDCEAARCTATSRTTCRVCGGEHCLGHADHERHVRREQVRQSP